MSMVFDLARALVAALPMLVICLLSGRGGLPVSKRAFQFPTSALAALYALAAGLTVERLLAALQRLLSWLAGVAALLPFVGSRISAFLLGLLDEYPLILTMNLVLALVWLALRASLSRPLAGMAQRSPWLREAVAERFYEPVGRAWYLRNGYQQTRRFFHLLWWVFTVMAILDMALCRFSPTGGALAYSRFPILGVIVLGEVLAFLQGPTAREAAHTDDGEEKEQEPADLDKLHRELEETFGDRLLAGSKNRGVAGVPEGDLREELEEMCLAEEGLRRIAGNYFLHRMQQGQPVSRDHVQAALLLLHGQSVLFCDPFYRDLTGMLMLPVQHLLLDHKRVLVVSGRCSGDEDVLQWLREGLLEATGLENLWRVDLLRAGQPGQENGAPDVGVLRFHDLYDLELQQANQAFFSQVALVVLLEPSNLMGSGQVGLRSVCQQCEAGGIPLTYCISDRNCDGMVDALSHTVRQSLVEVAASPVPRSDHHQMLWAVEGAGVSGRVLPHVSHYLGFGCELGVMALREKVEKVYWYGGSRFALQDMRWAVGQYARGLCDYIGRPVEQSELDERFAFVNGLWQARRHHRAFVMVEDEFYNLFEMARAFAARADGEGFVNVLSTAYMMRDYMCANAALLENDPKAIPTICPDFARTQRNFILRALMLMAAAPQEETALRRELSLYGCAGHDVYQVLRTLIATHTGLSPEILQVFYRDEPDQATGEVIGRKYFAVSRKEFGRLYSQVLCPAFFVIENERRGVDLIGARMMGQVCQTLLPGQFFSYNGRHYEVTGISAQQGVTVRRAADHLAGRPCYRQLRTYTLEGLRREQATRDLYGIQLQRVSVDLRVDTDGYLVLPSADDLQRARKVELGNTVESRQYTNKDALLACLPDADDQTLFTLCALLNELFVTLYPNEQGFVCATPCGVLPADDLQRAVVPALRCDGTERGVLVLEDCYMDLGLVVSVERNFQRILEMLADYLDWYLDKERTRRGAPPPVVTPPAEEAPAEEAPAEEAPAEEAPAEEAPAEEAPAEETPAEETPAEEKPAEEKPAEEAPTEEAPTEEKPAEEAPTEETTAEESPTEEKPLAERAGLAGPARLAELAPGQTVEGEDEELLRPDAVPLTEPLREYLAFGGTEDVPWLALEQTKAWLADHRMLDSALHRARCGDPAMEEYLRHLEEGQHVCDFCGAAMEPGSYEILKDGRERCAQCGSTAVRRLRDARALYEESHALLEKTFGISLRTPITIRVTNAKAIAKELGMEFKPGKGFDGRALGFARNKNGRYTIYLETGSPRDAMQSTILHELTHVWQYENWQGEDIAGRYGKDAELLVYEGMAVWVEIQAMLCTGNTERARRYEYQRLLSQDEYGLGLALYEKRYPFCKGVNVNPARSPFGHIPPL